MNMPRITKKSVTCFLKNGEEYLFIHRTKKGNDSDANRLNGIGGKLEYGENFLQAAVRETYEETGYVVAPEECVFRALINMQGGYQEDWVICFFVIEVPTRAIPFGSENDEGQLIWLHKDAVLTSPYELVDDLHYCWERLVNTQDFLHIGAVVNDAEKIETFALQTA